MAAYHLEKCCTVGDAAGLAKNNMQAFGGEKWWNLLWEDASPGSPASRITDAITRQPQVLLTARDIRRHQMVVETATGEVVGYARWILPESRKGEWLDAQTPDVSNEEIKRFNEHHVKARFNNYNLNAMDKQMHLMMGKHRPKTFIGTWQPARAVFQVLTCRRRPRLPRRAPGPPAARYSEHAGQIWR